MTDTIKVEFIPANHWWNRAKWKLLEEYTSANNEVNVPVGFVSDGASVPWFFRPWFSPTGNYFGAALVHDYILIQDQNWPNANHQFWAELTALGIKTWRKTLLLAAVRLYYRWLHLLGKA